MSQRQLTLVFSNSRRNLKIETLNSARSRKSPVACSHSPLVRKFEQLQRERPEVAKVVEKLVDDVLTGIYWLPPLE